MTAEPLDMSTDIAWEEWGLRDPYFGVITDPRYRASGISDELKREFFESGQMHVDNLILTIRKYLHPEFAPKTVLDFGCGVGRLLGPFAAVAEEVVGTDVSSSMLLEAQRNCNERQLHNVKLLASDDELSTLAGSFDLIHSYIVFQHIPVRRGRMLFGRLLEHLRPDGVGAMHFTYSKTHFAPTHGVAPVAEPLTESPVAPAPMSADPEMQMNPYNVNEILFSMQRLGFFRTHLEFTNHAGELGVFLIFSRTGSQFPSNVF